MPDSQARPGSVVLGAGLMGRLLACELARSGHSVVVHEAGGPDAQGSAARVAAAMLAPLAESAVTEVGVVRMGHYGLTRWPQLLSQLEQPVFFQQNGTLVVWHRQDAPEATRFARQLDATQARVPELPHAKAVGAEEIALLEPALAQRFSQGYFLPEEGQLDNRALLDALLHQLHRQSVEIHWNSARNLTDFSPGRAGQPDWLFDCRGMGARPEWSDLRGVRGEVIRLHAPEVQLNRPVRLMHPRYPLYIAPKPDHVFVVGATEIESSDLSPASVRSSLELLSAAYAVHSGFAEARILEIASQCRPTLPDNLPAIRRLGAHTLQINGLYRHGFLVAPALLDVVMQWIENAASPLAAQFALDLD